ncbi:hypothetical protein NAT47_08495 [Flavobacterium sp. HXWNR69]|uniref:DUF4142 domain-containing protein n=1 Tax=Flavobacterium fragile TaxID=2949085 RepID=A0ABT0THK1_9FLAO|nr:hypothetical protein [Flavobacterium sp. HXWNR69]MCL9770455.1 hypothetical protein [Flavobacterium sp. HXWNR69]
MKKLIKILISIVFIWTIDCYCQQKNNEKLDFKNSIEYSIESVSNELNPLIKKINILFNDGDIDSLTMNDYHLCKSTINLNKHFVEKLVEVDNEINLKSGTIKYLEDCEKILDIFILPVIKVLNYSEEIDRNKIIDGISLIETSLKQTTDLSQSLDEFCLKYNLSRRMRDFDKNVFKEKIEKLKSELNN